MDRITDLLRAAHHKGVRLWSSNGQLHYKAPKGALTEGEIERLRSSRDQILAVLEEQARQSTTEFRPRLYRAPLSFSQLAHWHLHDLCERSAMRQIASATRLCGRLSVDALQQSAAEIVRRHDALRTRIVVQDGVPAQEITDTGHHTLEVHELPKIPDGHYDAEISRIVEKHTLEPIDVTAGPLFGMWLLRIRDNEHVLIVVMEHIVSDARSMGILLRDLSTAYGQVLKGTARSLPPLPIQFPDYAVRQRRMEQAWIESHGAYWNSRLASCSRVRFPTDESAATHRQGWGFVPLYIDKSLKIQLRDWCRLRRTTLAMGVLASYVALVLRWCNVSESVIQYQSDGRVSPDTENTIGFFASALYLRVEVSDTDRFVDLLDGVTEEYCRAYEHADFSYMAAQVPRPEFTRNTLFNWVPQGSAIAFADLDGSEYALACSPVRLGHPILKHVEWDFEPAVLLYDTDDSIVGSVSFPLNRVTVETMERFRRNFLAFIRALVGEPQVRVKRVSLLA